MLRQPGMLVPGCVNAQLTPARWWQLAHFEPKCPLGGLWHDEQPLPPRGWRKAHDPLRWHCEQVERDDV